MRYVGEPVAVVFAADPYAAEDAADLVTVEIEALPELLAADAPPGEFDAGHSTEAAIVRKGYRRRRQRRLPRRMRSSRSISRSAATAACRWRRAAPSRATTRRVTFSNCYGAAKVPHWNRDSLARMLGRAPSSVHLHEGHTGGGFGIRGELYPEDVLVCLAALRLNRPVKWIEDRREHLIAANHSRQQHYRVRAAVDADGRLLAIDGEFFHDQGAYVRTHAATVPDLAAAMLLGPYRVAAYRMVGRIRLTNKTPCGTYRAPGRYESTFVRERLMDAIAARLGIDPIEIRRRNLIAASEMPYARRSRHARHRNDLRFRRLCRAARQGARAPSAGTKLREDLQAPARRRRGGRRRVSPCSSRKAGSGLSTACAPRSIPAAPSKS